MEWAAGFQPKILTAGNRADWLYWVGCTGSYEPLAQSVSIALLKILDQAGMDYALLAQKERCCGDPARRLGEEGLFQRACKENIETFHEYGVKNIVTPCPHCYNIFKNEYPLFGSDFKVYHHSQLLAQWVSEKKFNLSGGRKYRSAFYQDPCYLVRYNPVFKESREIIGNIPSLNLLNPRGADKSFCCGGGGGQMWLDVRQGDRVENVRFAQIEKFNPELIITACPFCKIMFDSATTARGVADQYRIKDISELLLESI
jgi:Fe-S oxidoreductase